ncbi:MAG: OmpA family protein [Chitinophagales bacterium]|nr:OmpA family protein [Chitinophagales bacterium]
MKFSAILYQIVFLFLVAVRTDAQILNPKKILERKANKAIEKKTEQAIDSIFTKKEKPAENKTEETDSKPEEQPAKEASVPVKDSTPSLQTYSKFDFIPGEKIIFYDDFSQDNIGDFPALWNTNGSAEVVTTNLFPGQWLQLSGDKTVWTDALLNLPENYTIEMDVIPTKGDDGRMAGYGIRLMQAANPKAWDAGSVPGKAGFYFAVEYFGRPGYRTYINSEEGRLLGLSGFRDEKQYFQQEGRKYHISIWVQKSRIRLYVNESKLVDLPKAFPLTENKMDRIRFEDGYAMYSNIRIAAGAPDMRNKLMTDGKIVSYGIYFDVNKDVVKPESYGSLKEIASILKENESVKITIVGHTDADGADAANLDLSKRRALAVKNELAKSFGIDPSRMNTDGKGETQPVAPNDKPVNKALNRRVEFIKQ